MVLIFNESVYVAPRTYVDSKGRRAKEAVCGHEVWVSDGRGIEAIEEGKELVCMECYNARTGEMGVPWFMEVFGS